MSPLQITAVILLAIILIPASLFVTAAAIFGSILDDDDPDESGSGNDSNLYRGFRPLNRNHWHSHFDDGYDIFCD